MTLEELYEEAAKDNVFFAEYSGIPAAAGDLRDYEYLQQQSGKSEEEFHNDFMASMGIAVDLCILGDVKGRDRVANCQSAWDNFKKQREKHPDAYPKITEVRKKFGLPIGETKNLGTF